MSHFEALFSSRFFFEFSTVAYFIVIWQLMSNYELIRLKRSVSSFMFKLCNELFFSTAFNAPCICPKIRYDDYWHASHLLCFWIKKLVLTALYSRGTNAPSKNKKRKEREKNKLCHRWCSKPASHPLPVEIRSPMFPFFGLDSIGSRVSGKEPSTLACSASDSKPYFSLRACSASQVTSSHQPLRMPAYYEKFRYLTSNTHASCILTLNSHVF